jgi:peptidoglycan/xylan/chitin deacetylase (PgdA/CDA1 family)
MMNREEVRQAAAEHEIGAHSFDHASMAQDTDAYLVEDVQRCRAWIEAVTRAPMRIYAFPNGSHRPGQPEAALAAGAEHVLLAGGSLGAPGPDLRPGRHQDGHKRRTPLPRARRPRSGP